jgi:ribonuclease P protein component
MLPRSYRLPPRQQSHTLFRATTPYFTAKVSTQELPHPRFGFVVSKKVSTNAVTRNRIRRQIRSGVEDVLPRIQPGYDILFIVQKDSLLAEGTQLKAAVLSFLHNKALIT